jgi:hypothetical protein
MQRMRTYDPEMKLIVVLRNPVERAYSHFQMMRALSEQEGPGWWATERHSSFGVALAVEARRLRKDPRRDFPSAYFVHSYLGRGLYSSALENVLAFFPREQLCVIRSDHLRDRHRQTMTEVFSFLGVDPDVIPPAAIVHAKQYPDMPLAYRRFLSWRYAREIKRLEELLGWDLEEWRT